VTPVDGERLREQSVAQAIAEPDRPSFRNQAAA
jgi:hypothetical protein